MDELFQSSSWDTPSIIAVGISLLSLVVSLITVVLYRKEIKIINAQFEQEQSDREARKIKINVWKTSKYEIPPDHPLKWVECRFFLNNQTSEQPFLAEVDVGLHFVDSRKWENMNFFQSLISLFLNYERKISIGFPLYSRTIETRNMSGSDEIANAFYLIDWETKTPIYFAPRKEYRLPEPGQKKEWCLFGFIPEVDGMRWMQSGYQLEKISLIFITDIGRIEVEDFVTGHVIDEDIVQEYRLYTFEYETSPISIFGPHYPV